MDVQLCFNRKNFYLVYLVQGGDVLSEGVEVLQISYLL